jgi:uncharacterized protein YnzC (UPF0291/DUF896 family)
VLSEDKITRINELVHKSKTDGLTESEKKEQQELRNEYVQSVRSSLKANLMSVKVVDEEGTDVTPSRLKKEKAKRKKH